MKKNSFSKEKIKSKVFNVVPIVTYVCAFLFTVLFEIVNVKFDFKIVITEQFWMMLFIKYAIVLSVLGMMKPIFINKLKQGEAYINSNNKARDINRKISDRKLQGVFVDYTKEKMKVEEEECFKNMLSDCGKIDPTYLEPKCTIEFIKKQYKEKKLHKEQYRLLINIKKGRLKFHKLNGNEIKYIGETSSDERNRYANKKNTILFVEVGFHSVVLLIFQLMYTILLQALFSSGHLQYKGDFLTISITVFTTILNYLTALLFAKTCADKQMEEVNRFTAEVTSFAERFVEAIDTKQYIPKVEDEVKAQLEKFNEETEEEDEEEITLTDEELKLVMDNREKNEESTSN